MNVYDQLKDTTYNIITDQKLVQHWIRTERLQVDDIQNIDWKNQERAMKLAGITRSRFVTKWVRNYVATGKNMKRWNLRLHGNCPYCLEEEEDIEHILKCQHNQAKENSKNALWQLIKQLVKIGTCRRAVIAIKQEIIA